MVSDGVNMPGPSGDGDPAASQECLLCGRRRFTPRRHASSGEGDVASSSGRGAGEKRRRPVQSPPASSSSSSSEGSPEREEGSAAAVVAGEHVAAAPVPEEASTAAEVWPLAFGSVSLAGRMREMEDAVSIRPAFCTWADGSPMHFFAVFDGHGGPHVRHRLYGIPISKHRFYSLINTNISCP